MFVLSMTIGFYNPYLDGLGGGERYTLTLASHWSKTHDVFLFWDDQSIIKRSSERFNLDLSRIKVVRNIFQHNNLLNKLVLSKQYDLIFFLTDGSIPASAAKHNILHFQVPFPRLSFSSIKMHAFQSIVCNSRFTLHYLDQRFQKRATVIYPPVAPGSAPLRQKKKIILSVGRFSSYFQAKKQEILINAFQKVLETKKMMGWRLVLAGGLLESDQTYYKQLVDRANGISVDFFPNISFDMLRTYYQDSALYWHAAGYHETDPTLMEHFGISTVEAMSFGCIPLSYDGGGQPEIIQDGVNGFLWSTTEELIEKTYRVIDDTTLAMNVQDASIARAKDFDTKRFFGDFDALLSQITS